MTKHRKPGILTLINASQQQFYDSKSIYKNPNGIDRFQQLKDSCPDLILPKYYEFSDGRRFYMLTYADLVANGFSIVGYSTVKNVYNTLSINSFDTFLNYLCGGRKHWHVASLYLAFRGIAENIEITAETFGPLLKEAYKGQVCHRKLIVDNEDAQLALSLMV